MMELSISFQKTATRHARLHPSSVPLGILTLWPDVSFCYFSLTQTNKQRNKPAKHLCGDPPQDSQADGALPFPPICDPPQSDCGILEKGLSLYHSSSSEPRLEPS